MQVVIQQINVYSPAACKKINAKSGSFCREPFNLQSFRGGGICTDMIYEKFDDIDWITPSSKEFAFYWRSLDQDQLVPRRSSFDPAKISSLLPGIAIYEVKSVDEIICRLAGTALVDRFGMEVTGMNFLNFWEGERREMASVAMNECVSKPCGMFTKLSGVSHSGRAETSLAAGFPLLDDDGTCSRLVFYSSNSDHTNVRIPREDQMKNLMAEETVFIALDR